MIGIFSMFIILFRNIKLSLIGVVPNFIAAFFILGIIGLIGIPLDMMTITIAAITIGIAVDNSIHYIYRFKEEFSKIKEYSRTLKKCHSTVGNCYFKYVNHYCLWIFNPSFFKIYSYNLFWDFHRYCNVACNDICFDSFACFNFNYKTFWKIILNARYFK